MKTLVKTGSIAGLVLTLAPSVFFFLGKMELDTMKLWMGIGMVVWMVTAPFWINKTAGSKQSQ